MIGRFVRQVGLFSLARTRIPNTHRGIPIRWASDDKKIGTIDDLLKDREKELGITDAMTEAEQHAAYLKAQNERKIAPDITVLSSKYFTSSEMSQLVQGIPLGTIKIKHEIQLFIVGTLPEIEKVDAKEAAMVKMILEQIIHSLSDPNAHCFDTYTDALIDSFTWCRTKHPLTTEVFSFALKAMDEFESRKISENPLTLKDNWLWLYKQGQICVKIIRTHCNEILAQEGESLLSWVKELADSSDTIRAAERIYERERCYPSSEGPLRTNIENWWIRLGELSNRSKFDKNIQVAIENLSVIANKLTQDILDRHTKSASPNNRR